MAGVRGLRAVTKMLKDAQARHSKGFERGLKKAGLFLLRESLQIVPVDKGNLRASGFCRAEGTKFKTRVIVGYTAEYAIWVHEDLELRHGKEYNDWYREAIDHAKKMKGKAGRRARLIWHERGEKQQAKFLSYPMRKHHRELVNIVKEEMKNS